MLACVQWLAEFQILSCIPTECNPGVPVRDVAELAGVPEVQLSRVVRLAATGGFLREPTANHVSHTPLSAHFATNQSLLDATAFLARSATPAALHMASATSRLGLESAYAVTAMQSFTTALEQRPTLRRQYSAYQRHVAGVPKERAIVDVLLHLDWSSLGDACIVEVSSTTLCFNFDDTASGLTWDPRDQVGAKSDFIARRLAERFPRLRLVVQISDLQPDEAAASRNPRRATNVWHGATRNTPRLPMRDGAGDSALGDSPSRPPFESPKAQPESGRTSVSTAAVQPTGSMSFTKPRIAITHSLPGSTPRSVTDAAGYILHLPAGEGPVQRGLAIRAELQRYLGVLRAGGGFLIVLTPQLLPEPGSLSDPQAEAVARTRDLHMLQLTNEVEMETGELLELIEATGDGTGKLAVVHQLRSQKGLVLAVVARYKAVN